MYDGVPLHPGFSSAGAQLLATFCGSNADDELTVTAKSGVMTVFFEAVLNSSSMFSHISRFILTAWCLSQFV